jgi:hypothetical protein
MNCRADLYAKAEIPASFIRHIDSSKVGEMKHVALDPDCVSAPKHAPYELRLTH